MIIKGSSRGNPAQLTRHLLRTDTNERVIPLEVQNVSGDLGNALDDWQATSALTNSRKGLYHANIDADARYPMTDEQWIRAADVLAEELGLTGQPRAIIKHEKKGRSHIHVVWQRTDAEREVMIPDSMNYKAHERASARLEKEFGHEHVPGRHAKRDRDKERPTQAFNHAQWQQAERTGVDPRERKAAITELYQSADSAEAFRAAVTQQGYILAQGDRRAFVLVDERGEVYSLARNIDGVKTKDIRERLAGLELASIPTVEDAKTLQKERAAERAKEGEGREAAPQENKTRTKGELSKEFTQEAQPPQPSIVADAFDKAAPPPLTVAQQRDINKALQRFKALEDDLERRQKRDTQAENRRHLDTLAQALGVPVEAVGGWQMVLDREQSRFAPASLREAEQALSPEDRDKRRRIVAELSDRHTQELRRIHDSHTPEREQINRQQQQELDRLAERFERERKRAEEAEVARRKREEARERERTRDDGPEHTR